MKQFLLWGLLLLATSAWAQSFSAEYQNSMRTQKMLAGSSIAYGNNLPGELAILQQKRANLPKDGSGNAKFNQEVQNFIVRIEDERIRTDRNLTIASTLVEGSQAVYKVAKFAEKMGFKHPWVVGIAKTGDVMQSGYDAIPNRYKPEITFGPARLQQEATKFYDGKLQEALDLLKFKGTPDQKSAFVSRLQNPYYKDKATKYFNDGKPAVAGSTMTVEEATAAGLDADTKTEEIIDAQVDFMAKTTAILERSYITALETKKEIANIKASIKVINQELRATNLTQQQILQKQQQLTEFTRQFAVNVDLAFKATSQRLTNIEGKLTDLSDPVLQSILRENVGIDDKISLIQKAQQAANAGQNTVFGPPTTEMKGKINDMLKHYENEKERLKIEQYTQIADKAVAYGQLGLAAMDRFNIGSEKDRKFIKNAIFAVRVGAAAARAYGGDPSALIQIGFELLSKPKPSPEMMMLQRIDQRLEQLEQTVFQGFESVHQQIEASHQDLADRINFVNQQVGNLRQQMANEHIETMVTLEDIQNRLNFVVMQNFLLDAKLTQLLNTDTDACFEPYNTYTNFVEIDPVFLKADSQLDYLNSFISGQRCESCLDGMLKLLNKDFLGTNSAAWDYTVDQTELSRYVDNTNNLFIQPQLYDKLLSYWKVRFLNNPVAVQRDLATVAMLYPAINASALTAPMNHFISQNPTPTLRFTETLDSRKYINYKKVVQLANYVYKFYPMLELYSGDANSGRLFANYTQLRQAGSFSTFRTQLLQTGLQKVLTLIERSMVHESLMSGNLVLDQMQAILRTKHHPETANLFTILRSNPIIAQNFASYLMATTIKTNEVFDANLKQFDNRQNQYIDLETLIEDQDAAYFFLKNSSTGLSLGIQKQYLEKNSLGQDQLTEDWVELPLIQDIQSTTDPVSGTTNVKELYVIDRLTMTNAFHELLDAREKIMSLITERQIMSGIVAVDVPDKLSPKKIDYILFNEQVLDDVYSNIRVAACQSLQSGPWSTTGTWSCGRIPTLADIVMINAGHAVTISDNTAQAKSLLYAGGTLTYNSAGRLRLAFTPPNSLNLSGNLEFGQTAVGQTTSRTLVIQNTGEPVTLTGLTLPAGFSGVISGTLATGASRSVVITFTPTYAGGFNGPITINTSPSATNNSTNLFASANINTLVNGLAMHLPFSGNANDASGNGNNGTVSGATLTTDRFGAANQAYSFARAGSQFVRVPNSTSINLTSTAVTLCAWVRPDWQGSTTNMAILSKAQSLSSSGRQYGISTNGPSFLNVDLNTGIGTPVQSWSCSSCTLQPNVWQFITIVYDGTTLKWYKDGVPLFQIPKTGNIIGTTSDLIIGAFADRTQSLFNGAIDDVRIYNRALSITEIWDLVQL
ncbi:hypothetical protein F5984_17415 [Rudanella paleaurantiibacter]|uniref:LamG-like jellyroll fold domain-containing protein n=1 Tax=Rudanella paleaurantiibacter TaxID=2614655 RepID=A0A7J5TVZ3_9BACT|nr:LamG-like jellyroll fold domain-containing protein [Rudanella paleaurantiibacter]KAB7728620.1 hypothetical protein F5984_17415 [Rudanella paleaurantiibacter]